MRLIKPLLSSSPTVWTVEHYKHFILRLIGFASSALACFLWT